MAPSRFQWWCEMDRYAGVAALLAGGDRKDLAIQALARSETVSDLAARHGVSRKFVYQQMHRARAALADDLGREAIKGVAVHADGGPNRPSCINPAIAIGDANPARGR